MSRVFRGSARTGSPPPRRSRLARTARAGTALTALVGSLLATAAATLALTDVAATPAAAQTCFTQGDNGSSLLDDQGIFTVPATGVTSVQVQLNGQQGQGWQTLDSNGNMQATVGGSGSALEADIPVTPGSTIEIGTLPGGPGGSSDAVGYYYQDEYDQYTYEDPPQNAGYGGAAQFLEVTGSCPQILAIAGAGGGGAGSYSGGAGGNADLGSGATAGGPGGANDAVDGAGGGGANSQGGGGGGAAGYDHYSSCANGNGGQSGGLLSGGTGANGADDTVTPSGVVECNGGGAAGGGGSGYYFGGGGGSGFDDSASGAGGGGSTYVAPGSTMVSDTSVPFVACGTITASVFSYYCMDQGAAMPLAGPGLTPIFQTDTTLSASPDPTSTGQPVQLTAQVSEPGGGTDGTGGPANDGSVTFYDDSASLGSAAVSNGVATLEAPSFPPGTHNLTADYSGGSGTNQAGQTDIDQPSSTTNVYPEDVVPFSTPEIFSGPAGVTSLAGDSVSFTAAAYGNPSPTVQWQVSYDGGHSWANIPGATSATNVYDGNTPLSIETTTSYSFTATAQDENDQYRAEFTNGSGTTPTNSATLSFYEADQIAVSPSTENIDLGTSQQLSATAYYPNGESRDVTGSVSWSSTDTSAVSVSSSGLATAVGRGADVAVDATLSYPGGYSVESSPGAQLTVSILNPSSIVVTPSSPTVAAGGQEQFTATGYFANGYSTNVTNDVNWQSSDPSVASEGYGLFSVSEEAGSGSATISASLTNGSFGQATLTTTPGLPESITLSSPISTGILELGDTTQLTATATYGDGTTANVTSDMSWSAGSPSIASVNSSGLVTGTSTTEDDLEGTIYGTYTDPGVGQVPAQISFIVSLDNPESIAVSPSTVTLSRGGSENFTAVGSYPNGYTANLTNLAEWYTGNGAVAVTSGDGQVTAQATAGGQSTSVYAYFGSASGSATINVALGDATSITVSVPDASLGLGQTEQLTATAHYENGTTADVTDSVAWYSNDPSDASISSTGLVTGLQPFGTSAGVEFSATLTYGDGTQLPANTSGVAFTVNDNDPLSISVTPAPSTLFAGDGESFKATGHYPLSLTADITNQVAWSSNSSLFLWDSGNTFENEVTGTGGSATVEATMNSVSGTASVTLLSAVSVGGASSDTTTTGPGYVSPAFTASGGSGTYDWQLSGPYGYSLSTTIGSSVTIDGSPTVSDAGNSPLGFTLIASDANNPSDQIYFAFSLYVNAAGQTISFGTVPSSAVAGTSITLDATGGASGNTIVYTAESGTGTSCYVSGDKLSFYNGPDTCIVFANQAGNSYYDAAQQAYAMISVLGQQTIAFTSTAPTGVVVGSQQYLALAQAAGSADGNLSVSIDSSTTNNACSISGANSSTGAGYAFVNFDHAGTCVIDANEAGTTYYAAAAEVQQTITVGQLSQELTITSAAPSDATVGGSYTPAATPGASGDPVVLSIDGSTTGNACSATAGVVSFANAGECVVDFDEPEPATSDYAAAPQQQQSFEVYAGSQSIAITMPSTGYVGASEAPVATGGGSDNPVTFTVGSGTTDNACTYSAQSLTFANAGNCELDANQAGNGDYSAARQAVLDISVVQLQLVFTSVAFASNASTDPTTPFTIQTTTVSGQPYVSASGTTIDLATSSSGGVIAATSGGAPVTALTIPAGQSSVTGYYADTQAGSPWLSASDTNGITFEPALQAEAINPDTAATLSFSTQPVDQVVGNPQSSAVAVTALDQFGNPVPGASVTLQPSSGTAAGASSSTGGSGVAVFLSLSFPATGTFTLEASSGNATQTTSDSFSVFASMSLTSISPEKGTSAGGTTVTIRGSGLEWAQAVLFGNTPAASFTIDSDTKITAVTPASASGTVDVRVANGAQATPVTAADEYYFNPFLPTHTWLAVSSSSSVPGEAVDLRATVRGAPEQKGVPAGSVSFYDGSQLLATSPLVAGVATFSDSSLPSGTGQLTVAYSGDDNYGGSTSEGVQHFVGAGVAVTLTATAGPFAYTGQQVTFAATVTGTPNLFGVPTGFVKFMNGTQLLGSVTLGGAGDASLGLKLTTGLMHVTAVYNGSHNYVAGTSAPVTEDVYGPVVLSISTQSRRVLGTEWTLTAAVRGTPPTGGVATGTVTIYDGSALLATVTLAQGSATYSTKSLPVGINNVRAQYNGSSVYYPAYSNGYQVKILNPVALSVDASPSPAEPGATVTLTAHLSPAASESPGPGGTVTFSEGSTTLGAASVLSNETAVLQVPASSLGVGADKIQASYSGDGYYARAKSPVLTEDVEQPSDVSITSYSPQPATFGSNVEVIADVGGTQLSQARSGNVTLYSGTKAVATEMLPANGQVTFDVSDLHAGEDALTVSYRGAFPYEAATSAAVDEYVFALPTVAVTASANPAAPGSDVTFTAKVSGGKPFPGPYSGTVGFYENGSNLIGTSPVSSTGVATVTTSFSGLGPNYIVAAYSGSGIYDAASSPVLIENVSGLSSLALTSSNQIDTTGADVTLTASVTGTPSSLGTPAGTVDFDEGGTVIAIGNLSGGQASVDVPAENFQPGEGRVTAVYVGGSPFDGSTSAPLEETLRLPTLTGVVPSTNAPAPGTPVTLTANVYGYPASWPGLVPSGSVSYFEGKTLLGMAPLGADGASLTLSSSDLKPGVDAITAKYAGDDNYARSTSSPAYIQATGSSEVALAMSKNSATVGDIVTLKAHVASTSAGGPAPTGQVTFLDGTLDLGVANLGSAGLASLKLATAIYGAGTMQITASYGGDLNYAPSVSSEQDLVVSAPPTLTPTFVQLASTPNPAAPGARVSIVATVTGEPPTASTPTGSVAFYDGLTKLGYARLDSNGIATYRTSTLPAGNDNLSAVYRGDPNFQGSTGYAFESIGNPTQTVVTSSANNVSPGTSVTFTATVTGAPQSFGVPTGTVSFYAESSSPPATPLGQATLDSNGVGSVTVVVKGTETVFAFYMPAPGSSYSSSQSNPFGETTDGPMKPGKVPSDAPKAAPQASAGRRYGGQ